MPRQINERRGAPQSGWVAALASPHLSVLFFLLAAAASLGVAYYDVTPTALMAAPFALLLVNVAAAIMSSARFRADLPLLVFHLALLVLVAQLLLARLIYMDGTTTLSSGAEFEGHLISEIRGPLHQGRLADVHFANDGFSENYSNRNKLHATYNLVRWQDDGGLWHAATIGDDHPLLIKGYKIYASHHRGFSPVFVWQTPSGIAEYGTVQLADQLGGAFVPAITSTLPNGSEAWIALEFNESEGVPGQVRIDMGSKELAHSLVLRIGDVRHTLRVGERIDLPGGTLTYVQLDSWMGYVFSYDPTRPWIVATVLIGIGSLIAFYWRRVFLRRGPAEAEDAAA